MDPTADKCSKSENHQLKSAGGGNDTPNPRRQKNGPKLLVFMGNHFQRFALSLKEWINLGNLPQGQ